MCVCVNEIWANDVDVPVKKKRNRIHTDLSPQNFKFFDNPVYDLQLATVTLLGLIFALLVKLSASLSE